MDIVLPKEINYVPSLPALPECISQDIVLSPVNGNTFGPGQLIQFDLTSRGFMDPTSLYIRYKVQIANGTTETSQVRATPVYTFFNKLETFFGSQSVENISGYNQVMNMMVNLQYDVAMKYGNMTSLGYKATSGGTTPPSLEELDGRVCRTNESFTVAAPLSCILSSSEKLIPLGMFPNVRIQLTTEAISNVFMPASTGTVANFLPTGYTISNCELCYDMIDFSGGVNDMVKSMGEKFFIKSSSFQNMGISMPVSTGTQEIVYNMRLASIKSLFALFSGNTITRCTNGIFDSVDPTVNTGDFQFQIAGSYYPSRPVSTLNNKASFLMELKHAVGALHSTNYNFSINNVEFESTDQTTTTLFTQGKFIFGVNTEKLSSNGVILSGISTQSSPISLRINSNFVGTTNANQSYIVYVIAMYDCLIEVDTLNRQATVKQ